jgi:hypothetical protein
VARFNKILSRFKAKKIRWVEYTCMTLSGEMAKHIEFWLENLKSTNTCGPRDRCGGGRRGIGSFGSGYGPMKTF